MEPTRTIDGVRIPPILYGTAWKEERTHGLVRLALAAGFRGLDTANQRKHYVEADVGAALGAAVAAGEVVREDIFVQTKFTHRGGQDQRLPYDPRAPIGVQVKQSCARSLEHLGIAVIDSYLLHGPSIRGGLAPADIEAWRAMEDLRGAGTVRLLGISNVSAAQLDRLLAIARAPIAFVQNRCYASAGWDRDVRARCRERGITYQGFSVLTANRKELAHSALRAIALRVKLTPEQLVFRFAVAVGMLPLTGTSSAAHMAQDLAALTVPLEAADVQAIEAIARA